MLRTENPFVASGAPGSDERTLRPLVAVRMSGS